MIIMIIMGKFVRQVWVKLRLQIVMLTLYSVYESQWYTQVIFLFTGMMSMGMGMMPHTTAVSINNTLNMTRKMRSFVISDQVLHKPACTVDTEERQTYEILDLSRRGIVLSEERKQRC